MAYEKQIKLPGDQDTYAINANIKSYALRDVGFEASKRGNYEYVAPLDQKSPFNPVVKLKIFINSELDGLKMKVVNQSGSLQVNIFESPRSQEFIEQLHYILDEMIDREILTK